MRPLVAKAAGGKRKSEDRSQRAEGGGQKSLSKTTAGIKRQDARTQPNLLECGGNQSATPLWKLDSQPESGVAVVLCHRTPKFSSCAFAAWRLGVKSEKGQRKLSTSRPLPVMVLLSVPIGMGLLRG